MNGTLLWTGESDRENVAINRVESNMGHGSGSAFRLCSAYTMDTTDPHVEKK